MNALVTGGTGFIGSHLVDSLILEDNIVTVIDNLSTGTLENLKHHENNDRLTFSNIDLNDEKRVDDIMRKQDIVFHLAAHANIRVSLRDHKVDLENNVKATINVLEAMNRNGVEDLVFASTSAIYGEATVRPTPENYAPTQTSLYGASKLACEAYMEAYTQFSPINIWSFRFANVIGERCRRGVIWDFVHKLWKNPKSLKF